ncbi:MAG: hypothetical protein WAM14_02750 [Candidatus Nitrosopolaris sp.]
MTVVGFNVTKEEREELLAIAREMYVTKFPHPQIQGIYITFLLKPKSVINYYCQYRKNY